MAEQQGFFRRIFSFGQAPEADRRAEKENLVAAPDIGAKTPASPDNDAHHPAAASTDTDTEAGADPNAPDEGGIEPLPASAPLGATTEKKTLKS
ncbi:hypothetical protein [Aureimonas mangrovi]|uniref:hypothetical protein n=1 Tax=Aureimonas mangrovi TaxID=2758041 RepID=UPI00163DCD66|nr:hypothetical protein [Aureimonas mangrovi]